MTTFPAGKSGNPVPAVSQDAKAKEKLPPPTNFAPSGIRIVRQVQTWPDKHFILCFWKSGRCNDRWRRNVCLLLLHLPDGPEGAKPDEGEKSTFVFGNSRLVGRFKRK